MKVSEHITYGAIASVGLSHWVGWNAVYFFIGSVGIDLDHYFEFLYYNKFENWSFKSMFSWYGYLNRFVNNTDFMTIHAYHTSEFLLALSWVVGYYRSIGLMFLWGGLVFHILLDCIRMHQNGLLDTRATSFYEYRLRKKGMINPEEIFRFHTDNWNRWKND